MIFPWVKLIPWGMGGLAALLLFGMGWRMGHNGQKAEVEQARQELSAFRTELALATAKGDALAAIRQAEAKQSLQAHQDAITDAVNGIPARVALKLAGQLIDFREALSAQDYACLRIPLPVDALELLRRPGSHAPESGGNPGTGEPPPSLF